MHSAYPDDLNKVLEFHGHMCPGVAIGYRLAKAALAALGYSHPDEGDLVTIAESDRCTIDPFQIILGCTLGKGKLYIDNTGKQAFSVGCRKSGKAVRVIQLPYNYTAENDDLTRRVMAGRVSDEEYRQYKTAREQRIHEILTMPANELLKVAPVNLTLPEKETIHNSPRCAFCGEQVMEPWTRLREGKIACTRCAIPVTR
ncbi:FmdE family protein [Anaeroselena agilis]|uniref:FmdE family protein n=1 Tax=Anaeroselena agilis TaxID=3063788 RepID=A0ABU3NSI0_9FIRM|nr:FmdE family protein [Selenomonadales bacterium 4137-cl]